MAAIGQISRRRFLAGATAVGGALISDACAIEPFRIQATRHTVRVATLPAGLDGMRIAQVSDIHLPGTPAAAERAARIVEAERPDVVVLTGDIVEHPLALPLLGELAPRLRGQLATVAILGNWEHKGGVAGPTLARAYAQSGVELLVDRGAAVTRGGARLGLLGFDDFVMGSPVLARALANRVESDYEVWLMHAPRYLDEISRGVDVPPDLVLAGHTHGGQIRLPGLTLFTPPGSGRYVSGWYPEGMSPMYVARGIGTAAIRARLFCPPELPIFTLRRA